MDVLPQDLDRVRFSNEKKQTKKADNAKKHGKEQTPKAPSTKIDANAFRTELSTHRVVGEYGRDIGHKPNWVEMSPDIKYELGTFMESYVKMLIEAQRFDPRALASRIHRHDKLFLELLTKETMGDDGRSSAEIDKGKIEAFFTDNPEGWALAIQALEDVTPRVMYAMGLSAVTDPEGSRRPYARDRDLPTGMAQGRWNKIWRGLEEFWGTPAGDFAGRHGEVRILGPLWRAPNALQNINRLHIAGLLVGGGMLIGGAAAGVAALAGAGPELVAAIATVGGLIPSGIEGGAIIAGRGVNIPNLTENVDAFNVIANNPAEANFMRALTGFDVNDYEVVSVLNDETGEMQQRINRRVDRAPTSTIDADTLQGFVLSNLLTRLKFYKEIGVPQGRIDALPEQFMTRFTGNGPHFTGSGPEELGVYWEKDYVRELNRGGGIRDGAGNRSGEPGYDPFNNGWDEEGNRIRSFEAHEAVITNTLERRINAERAHDKNPGRIKAIDAKLENLKPTGEMSTNRVSELTTRKATLEGDNTRLQAEKSSFEAYNRAVSDLQNARLDLSINFPGVLVTDIDAEVASRNDSLNRASVTTHGGYARELGVINNRKRLWVTGQIAARTTGLTLKARDGEIGLIQKEANEMFEPEKAELKERIYNKVLEEVAELKRLKRSIAENDNKVADGSPTTRSFDERLRMQTEAFSNMTTVWNTVGGVVLDENALRVETTEELIGRINAVNRTNPAMGWPDIDNGLPENRLLLLRAMQEARAVNTLTTFAGRTPDWEANFNTITDVSGFNISENKLRSLTPDQISADIMKRGIPVPAPEVIQNAINEASARLQTKIDAVSALGGDNNRWIRGIERDISGVGFAQESRNLNATRDLLQRQGDYIFKNARDIVFDIERFTNTDGVAPGDTTSTQAEIDAHASRGYFEFMDYLFAYKEKGNRAEYFNTINRILPPARFAELLNESLGYRLRPPLTLDAVFDRMRTRRRALTNTDIRLAFVHVMDSITEDVLAIV